MMQFQFSKQFRLFSAVLLLSLFPSGVMAENYPNMVGVWEGHIRTLSSGDAVSGQVAKGGAVISEFDLKVTIDHQDGETFIGKSRNSRMSSNQRSVPVWGAIRSNGKEAQFVGGGGGRGTLWFLEPNKIEYCITSLQGDVISAYCGVLTKTS